MSENLPWKPGVELVRNHGLNVSVGGVFEGASVSAQVV